MGTVGERIKECRLSLGMTQEAVAKRIGVQKQTIYKYENGIISNIGIQTIERLSDVFHVCPEYLTGWSDKRSRKGEKK